MLSVVVWMVTYNHEKYIEQAVESVMMQQTTFEVQLYIGDDCSTDKTPGICLALQKKYPGRIRLFLNKTNLGAHANGTNMYLNCIVSGARYIAILDGDDYWTDPAKLQKQFDFMEANPDFTMCFHNTLIKREYEKIVNKKEELFNGDMGSTVFEFKDIADIWVAHTSSVFFLAAPITPLPAWFKECFTGDLALILLLAGYGKLKYLDFTGSVYRLNDGGIGARHYGKFLLEGKIKMYELIDAHFQFKYTRTIRPVIGKYHFMLVAVNMREAKFREAVKNLARGIRLKPGGLFADLPLLNSARILAGRLSERFSGKKKKNLSSL